MLIFYGTQMFFYKILNNNGPVVFLLMPVFMLLLWGKTLLSGVHYFFSFDDFQMPCYFFLSHHLGGNLLLSVVLGFAVIAVQVALIIRLNVKYIIIENRSFFPAFLFIFLTGSFFQLQRLHPAMLANIFIFIAIDRLLGSYRKEKALSEVFDTFLLISLSSLFYFNAIYFVVFFWIAFLIIKPLNISEWFVSILGIITPYFFITSYYYLTENLPAWFYLIKKNVFLLSNKGLYLNYYYYVFFIFLLLLLLIAILYFIQGINIKKVVIRRFYTIFVLYILFCIAMFFVLPSSSVELLVILSMPVAFLFSYFFISLKNKWIKEGWVVCFITILVLIQIFK